MFYKIFRSIFFCLEAEKAHVVAFQLFDILYRAGLLNLFFKKPPNHPVNVMGISFPNPVGIAAGLDKNGTHLEALGSLGFGFIEIGTVTPQPQDGNLKPRLFRIPQHEALINKMGFNNVGVKKLALNLLQSNYTGILGINIGKNADTSLENAHRDYTFCLRELYEFGDYFTINISSPNTNNLRNLQKKQLLRKLLEHVIKERDISAKKLGIKKPLLVKLSPDLNYQELKDATDIVSSLGIEGIIATNTTISRCNLEYQEHCDYQGGLSGKPLMEKSTDFLKQVSREVGQSATIIGVGGVNSADDALLKFRAGANLIQIYTGLIYTGPSLLREILRKLSLR